MKVRSMFIQSLGVAVLFGASAFAQSDMNHGSGSTSANSASQSQSSDQGTATEKSSKSKSGGAAAMDKKFVMEAAQGGLAEVDLGNVAKQQGTNDAVKQFGDRMVTDHSKANDELKSLAQQKNWTLPTEPKSADKSKKDRLSKMSGEAFDKAYMRDMVMDHRKDVKEFQKCASSCQDQDLKAWAAKTAPILEDHLKMARDTAKQVGAMGGGANEKKKSGSSDDSTGGGGKPSGAIQ